MARHKGGMRKVEDVGVDLAQQTQEMQQRLADIGPGGAEPYVEQYPGASPATTRGTLRGSKLIDSPSIASPQFAMRASSRPAAQEAAGSYGGGEDIRGAEGGSVSRDGIGYAAGGRVLNPLEHGGYGGPGVVRPPGATIPAPAMGGLALARPQFNRFLTAAHDLQGAARQPMSAAQGQNLVEGDMRGMLNETMRTGSPVGKAPSDYGGGFYAQGGSVLPSPEHINENVANRRMIANAGRRDPKHAGRLLQGLRREHHGLRIHGAIALARGHDDHALHLLNHAHARVPDGAHLHLAKVGPDHFVANVHRNGQHNHALLNRGQLLQFATGPAGGFDHTLDNGLEKNLHILTTHGLPSGPRVGYQEGGDVGYQEGGEVGGQVAGDGGASGGAPTIHEVWDPERKEFVNAADYGKAEGGPVVKHYQEGGEVQLGYQEPMFTPMQQQQQPDQDQAVVREVLEETRREHQLEQEREREAPVERTGYDVPVQGSERAQDEQPGDRMAEYLNGTGSGAASAEELQAARGGGNSDLPMSPGDYLRQQAEAREREPGQGGELGVARDFGQAEAEGTQVAGGTDKYQAGLVDQGLTGRGYANASEIYMGPGMGGGGGGRRRGGGGGGGGGRSRGESDSGGGGRDTGPIDPEASKYRQPGDNERDPVTQPRPAQEPIQRVDVEGNPIGPPTEARPAEEPPAPRVDTSGRPIGGPKPEDTRTQLEKEQSVYDARQERLRPAREAQQREITAERMRQVANGTIQPGEPLKNPYDQQIMRRFPMGGGSEGPWGETNTASTRSYNALDAARSRWNRKYVLGTADADAQLTNQPRGGGSFVSPNSRTVGGRDVMPSDERGRSPTMQAEQGDRPLTRDIPRSTVPGTSSGESVRQSQDRFGNIPGPNFGNVPRPVAPAVQTGNGAAAPGTGYAGAEPAPVPMSPRGTFTDPSSPQYQPDTPAPAQQAPTVPRPQQSAATGPYQPQPVTRMPGGVSNVQPDAADQSPAAQAQRMFPRAADSGKRRDYQIQLEQEGRTQAGKESLEGSKQTGRQAVEKLKEDGRIFRNSANNDERARRTAMMKEIADQKTAEQHFNTLYRQGNYAAAEILKNLRVDMLNNPNHKPTDEQLGALGHLTGTIGGAPPAGGGTTSVTPTTPAATGMPDLRSYTGAQPPWAAPAGQKWQQHPTTRLYRLVPQ